MRDKNLYMRQAIYCAIVGVFCGTIFSGLVRAQEMPASPSSSRDSSSGQNGSKKEYYFKKILESEVAFLKNSLAQKEQEYKAALEAQKNKYEQMLQEQRPAQETPQGNSAAVEEVTKQLQQAQVVLTRQKDEAQKQQQQFEQSLAEQKKDYENKIEESLRANTSLKEKNQELEKQLQAAAEKEQQQREALSDERRKELETKMTQATAEISSLQNELASVKSERANEQKQFEETLIQKELEQAAKLTLLNEQLEKAVDEAEKKQTQNAEINAAAQARELQKNIDELTAQLEKQKTAHAQELAAKEKDYTAKLEAIIVPQKQAGTVEREQEQGKASQTPDERDVQIRALTQQVADLQAKANQQKFDYEQTLKQNDKRYAAKEKELTDKFNGKESDAEKALEQKLSEKYLQFDRAMREKNAIYEEQLAGKDRELKTLKEESQAKETGLRQLLAAKELEFGQKLEQDKKGLNDELAAIKTSSEQLRVYLIKLKEDLKIKTAVLAEKDTQIDLLNKKLALYSGEDVANKQKLADISAKDLEFAKKENARLQQEMENLTALLAREKEAGAQALAQQKQVTENERQNTAKKNDEVLAALEEKYEKKIRSLIDDKERIRAAADKEREESLASQQQELRAQTGNVSQEWEKKIQLLEAKYTRQLQGLEEEKDRIAQEAEVKLREMSDKLRAKKAADDEMKVKLGSFRDNQVELLEEMMISKATMMLKLPRDFRGAEKEKAQIYFDRAMNSIISKNYARAKTDLEQVLSVEPNNQITIDIMQSLDFLLERI